MSKKNGFHAGDLVRYKRFHGAVNAIVTEDRGNIGVGGRRLIRIRYSLEEPHWMETEVPEEKLELVERKKRAKTRS